MLNMGPGACALWSAISPSWSAQAPRHYRSPACGAARGFLSARLKAWEIKTTEARGGKRDNDDDTTCDATPFEKLRKPKVESAIEFGAFMLAHVTALYDFCVVNAEHPAIKDSDASAEIMGALADCLDVIKSAQAKNA